MIVIRILTLVASLMPFQVIGWGIWLWVQRGFVVGLGAIGGTALLWIVWSKANKRWVNDIAPSTTQCLQAIQMDLDYAPIASALTKSASVAVLAGLFGYGIIPLLLPLYILRGLHDPLLLSALLCVGCSIVLGRISHRNVISLMSAEMPCSELRACWGEKYDRIIDVLRQSPICSLVTSYKSGPNAEYDVVLLLTIRDDDLIQLEVTGEVEAVIAYDYMDDTAVDVGNFNSIVLVFDPEDVKPLHFRMSGPDSAVHSERSPVRERQTPYRECLNSLAITLVWIQALNAFTQNYLSG